MRHKDSRHETVLVILMALVLIVLAALFVTDRAYAADEWDILLPDEYGLAVFVAPAVERSDLGLATLSWQAFSVHD